MRVDEGGILGELRALGGQCDDPVNWDLGHAGIDTLIEFVGFRVENNDYLKLRARVTRDDGVRVYNLVIDRAGARFSDCLCVKPQVQEDE